MAINRAEQNWPENTVEVIADFIRESNESAMYAPWDWVAEAGLSDYRKPVGTLPVRVLPTAKRNELAHAAVVLAAGLATFLIGATGLYFALIG